MATNTCNIVMLTGRLAKDVVFFSNKDGSRKAKATIAVRDNYLSGPKDARTRKTQFIPVEQFLPATATNTLWDNVCKGSLVQIAGHMESNSYVGKDGNTVYTTSIVVDSSTYLESKAQTAARKVGNAAAAPAQEPAPAPESEQDIVDDDMPFGDGM